MCSPVVAADQSVTDRSMICSAASMISKLASARADVANAPELIESVTATAAVVIKRPDLGTIAPGAFASEMNTLARDHAEEVAKRIPSRRIGTDEDMAGAAIFLASRAGDYVVGSTLVVDGGVTHARG